MTTLPPFPQLDFDFDVPTNPGEPNDSRQSTEAPAGDPAQSGTPDPGNDGGAAQAFYAAVAAQQRALQPGAYNNTFPGMQSGRWPPGALPPGFGYTGNYLNTGLTTSSGAFRVNAGYGVQTQWAQAPSPPAPPLSTKIVAGEIVGWRCWNVDGGDGEYYSMAIGYQWGRPGSFRLATGEPTASNSQGVHAWKTEAQARTYAMEHLRYQTIGHCEVALGTVDLWGEVIEHAEGYRAEFAEIREVKEVLTNAATRRDIATLKAQRDRLLTQSWRASKSREERICSVAEFLLIIAAAVTFLSFCGSLASRYMSGS